MEFTDEQNYIINAKIGNILVSAAAGSGKTTVLVERIIRKIINGDFSVDEILVVTFTKDAAANMKNKIEKALKDRIKLAHGVDTFLERRLKEQLDLLPNSYIQTMDSFCTRVIREKGYLCSDKDVNGMLLPGNTVLDDAELKLILKEAVKKALNDLIMEEDDHYLHLMLDMFGDGRTDEDLVECVNGIFGKLRSMPDYIEVLERSLEGRRKADDDGVVIDADRFVRRILDIYRKLDDRYINDLKMTVSETQFVKTKNERRQERFYILIDRVYDYTRRVIRIYEETNDPIATIKAIKDTSGLENEEFGKDDKLYNGLPKDNDELLEAFCPVAVIIMLLKSCISGLKSAPSNYGVSASSMQFSDNYTSMLAHDEDYFLSEQKKRTAITAKFISLIKRTDVYYQEMKAMVHGMDFPDQEHMAKMILENREAGAFYSNRFKEIYIDEYQDNSSLQDSIIEAVSGYAEGISGNVFRVGDVKQSIYKFRYADPSMFIDKMERYDVYDPENRNDNEDQEGTLYALNMNHRSEKEILDFVNMIFEMIMSRDGAEIEYDETQSLKHPNNVKCNVVPHVRIIDSTEDDSNKGKDKDERLQYVSAMEQGVLSEVRKILDEGKYSGSDICILTRKRATSARLSEYLVENGIDAEYVDELSVFEDSDIHGIINIIMILGNELRDEYLLGVLLSPYDISNFTLEEVAIIQSELTTEREISLIGRLRSYSVKEEVADDKIRERVIRFLNWFEDLKNDLILTDIGSLVERIYRETGILATSENSRDKFEMLKVWLCDSFMRYGSDISTIASSLENMKIKLGGTMSVRSVKRTRSKITCMTYHGSKGLEFPCVIVTELYDSGVKSSSGPIVFSPQKGIVVNDYDGDNITLRRSIERLYYDEDELIASNAEGMRLLYVALTRAQNRLSVVHNIKFPKKEGALGRIYTGLFKEYEKKLGRDYWIYTKGGVDTAFIAALLRTKDASKLTSLFSNKWGKELPPVVEEEGLFDLTIDDYQKIPRATNQYYVIDIDGNDNENEDDDDSSDAEYVLVTVDPSTKIKAEVKGQVPLYSKGTDENGFPVFEDYPYEAVWDVPFKVSVSQIQHGSIEETVPMNLMVRSFDDFKAKLRGDIGESASQTGIFVHNIFRFIDMKKASVSPKMCEEAIRELAAEGIIDKDDTGRALEFKDGLYIFASSDIGKELVASQDKGKAYFEKPVLFATPAEENENALVQGIIDLMYIKADGKAVIIDYKTDRYKKNLSEKERANTAIRDHKTQVDCYAAAVTAAGIEVEAKKLYLVRYGQFVDL